MKRGGDFFLFSEVGEGESSYSWKLEMVLFLVRGGRGEESWLWHWLEEESLFCLCGTGETLFCFLREGEHNEFKTTSEEYVRIDREEAETLSHPLPWNRRETTAQISLSCCVQWNRR